MTARSRLVRHRRGPRTPKGMLKRLHAALEELNLNYPMYREVFGEHVKLFDQAYTNLSDLRRLLGHQLDPQSTPQCIVRNLQNRGLIEAPEEQQA
jgi:hypothetical protein